VAPEKEDDDDTTTEEKEIDHTDAHENEI